MSPVVHPLKQVMPVRKVNGWQPCVVGLLSALALNLACAQTSPNVGARPPSASAQVAEEGIRWNELKPAQQAALHPLLSEWSGMDSRAKERWIKLAERLPSMSPAKQARIQERMAAWSRMSPHERGEARSRYQSAKHLSVEDRQMRWDRYQAMTPAEKEQLAAKLKPAPGPHTEAASGSRGWGKSNTVPSTTDAAFKPRVVGPTVVEVRPGATTTLINRRPAPPRHQQAGLPKIAATPYFVDKATLLPQRGPQGAAAVRAPMRPADAAALPQP